ncbi:vacuolar transporter chaperone [Dissophora globulifera]|uniref:Vacuolar transporter chaperone n=1 Tax=Dissophora globulifera TaxID=979702 RepID=A0A9P6RNK1_9FUNG|nr:vacuolar transporter chaperone [Dissophora globulifera]
MAYRPLQTTAQEQEDSFASSSSTFSYAPTSSTPLPPRQYLPHQLYANTPVRYSPLPAPPVVSSHNIAIPKRGSSSDFGNTYPISTLAELAASSSTAAQYTHPLVVQDIHLEPPHRNFATPRGLTALATADRPVSEASFTNLSTHSNEPLNPSPRSTLTRYPARTGLSKRLPERPGSTKNRLGGEKKQLRIREPEQSNMRSLTPQSWHPEFFRNHGSSTPKPLNGLKDQHRRFPSDSDGELSAIDIDEDDRNARKSLKNVKSSADSNVFTKTRKNPFARLIRKRTQVTYDVAKTGRLAQFSNERLYLHWIRFAMLQGTIALTLLSFGYYIAAYIGVGAMIVALATLIYSTTLFHVRHLNMVSKRNDVVYYEKTVPTILCIALILLYGSNFVLTMSVGEDARSPPPWATSNDPLNPF